jgi:carboxyl-terminal processing protease
MKRRLIFGLLIVALLVNLAFGAKIYLKSSRATDQRDAATANLEIFSDVLDRIRSDYVDETNTAYQPLIYAAIKGMVSKLDPHSEFLDPEANQELQDETEGQFGGLGLVVAMKGGYVTVVSPMEDTPASRAGILTGDRIVKVEGNSVEKMALDDVVKQLRGDPDTTVSVTFERPSSGATKTYSLKRAIIQMDMAKDINDQKKFPLDENKIGYVRLTQFSEKAGDELEDALQKMKAQGLRGLILDLRWNPGGLLDQAVEVCQKFLPRGQLVVSTEGRHVVEKYFAKGSGDELKGIPIVVLVNLGSASAAEIVTGCLQDLHRAYVIGEKTFGKGSVQTIFPLDDGSALKLTVAKYYTPSHKVIHEHGITPDSLVPMTDAQEAAVLLKRAPGGMESLSENDRARVESFRDDQLDRAEDLLKAMILFNSADAAKN